MQITELMKKAKEEAKTTIEKPYYLHTKIMANIKEENINFHFNINLFVRKVIKVAVGSIFILIPSLLHGGF